MKIAFVGKGGSGKSTLATLFTYHVAKTTPVLAIDADINQHFSTLLGISDEEKKNMRSLGHEIDTVRTYVTGSNTRIKSPSHMRMTTPPASGSRAVTPTERDPLLSQYIIKKDNVLFATTGEFETKDVGMICYHGKTMATEIVFNHLADKVDEYVVTDMTAGADTFSTGIFLKFDMIVLVVEPTAQSLSVFKQFTEYGKEYGINIRVAGNKIETVEDELFIKNNTHGLYLGSIPYTKEIRTLEKGKGVSEQLDSLTEETLTAIKTSLDNTPKDWTLFYQNLVSLHTKHALSWLNNSFQTHFEEQIDPSFNPETFFAR
jgi:CO dehydrogenase maturation factor